MLRLNRRHALLAGMFFATSAFATPAQAATPCIDLVNLTIAAGDIGLPSGGATIASAEMATVPADPATPDAKRDYCKVLGAIAPVDPIAPPINFQVNLPAQWNGKAVQYGGGGSNGVLITGLEPVARRARAIRRCRSRAASPPGAPMPAIDNEKLAEPRAFALNDEALVNMAHAAYKKTHDVGVQHRARVLRPRAGEDVFLRRFGRRPRSPHDGAALSATISTAS